MSRQTPRKSRHRHNPSTGSASGAYPRHVPASDYESDVAHYHETLGSSTITAAMAQRTNTELNLGVLQRYLPSITEIHAVASNAVIYLFDTSSQEWDKSGVEGTMFICKQEPLTVGNHTLPRACVFILNRKGLDNAIINLANVDHCEFNSELIIMRLEQATSALKTKGQEPSSPDAAPKVLGLWVHTDESEVKEEVQKAFANRIQGLWAEVNQAQSAAAAEEKAVPMAMEQEKNRVGPALQAIGRRVSISDLFGHKVAHENGQ